LLAGGTRLLLQGPDCFYRDPIAFIFYIQGSNWILFCVEGPDCVSSLYLGIFV
jgi:hypothetical protein